MQKFAKGHNKSFQIFSNINQVICSSSPISILSILSFSIIAELVVEVSCLQDFIAVVFKGA